MNLSTFYVFGPADELKAAFPEYSGRDERYSLDRSELILELKLDEDGANAARSKGFDVKTHEEAVAFLASEEAAGKWRPEDADDEESSRGSVEKEEEKPRRRRPR